jgi:hypothetical protein
MLNMATADVIGNDASLCLTVHRRMCTGRRVCGCRAECHIEDMENDLTLIRVYQPYPFYDAKVSEFWVAALPPEQAIAAVLVALPPGEWKAELANPQLSAEESAGVRLQSGEVVDYSRSRQ